ncbi:MAG: hypothetical protein ACI85Q_002361 [Salibacteraceae bacterium]|jgi:hypothetical protein
MANFLVTYNIDNASNRTDFVAKFEEVLQGIGLEKQETNQSTYYGPYPRTKGEFSKDLYNAVSKLDWKVNDEVTIYYPKVSKGINNKNVPDIGMHLFITQGNKLINFNIIS